MVSEVLSSHATTASQSKQDSSASLSLNGQITLADLGAFYTIEFGAINPNQTISEYISHRFFRRVVVGDDVQLDQLILTVRQIDEQDRILQVGIKPA